MLHGRGRRTTEHHVELGEAEHEPLGLVDQHHLDLVAELLGEPRRQLESTESRTQHQYSHGCESTASRTPSWAYSGPVYRLLPFVLLPLLLLALAAPATAREPLPVGTDLDYQLGGARSVPANVGIVVRDRKAPPVAGRYNVCYVNGFQTQTDERRFWNKRPGLILKRHGHRVIDSAWGEWLLDIRTAHKRQRLAGIMRTWVRGLCRARATTPSSSTTSTRSPAATTCSSAARPWPTRGCSSGPPTRAGLSAGQKNLAEFNGRTVGYDFAIAEECGRYRECSVVHRRTTAGGCCRSSTAGSTSGGPAHHFGARLPVVLRDLDLTPHGVREWC